MADISQEIDQLRNAVYGEEVRGAFISCMQKIHEENESYNSIKESVNQSVATMQEQVESINTKSEEVKAALQNLTTAIANGKDQQDAIEKATAAGKIQQTATEKATSESKTQQTAIEKATETSKTQQTALQNVVDSAKQIDSAIQQSVTAANTAANNASAATKSATEATSLANQSAEAAKTATTNANDATKKTNAAVKNASDATEQAAQATSAANAATENANQATVAAKSATQEALTQAEEAKQAAASVRDDCYPMMFRNYDGRTYSVFFEDADETMVCTGTKEDDNADVATPVPSTNAVRNENPYDEIPLFKPVECNGYADEGGELHITAVKGEPEFRTDGTKGDVCIALKTGYIRTIIDTVGIMGPLGKKGTKISVTDSWRESEYPGFPFIPYTDEVYFAVTGEKASKESIAEDFDYWYNKGEEITQGELADKYSLEELRMQAYSNASEACEKTIYAGIDVEISTGTEHFSLTEKDQLNLFGKKMQLLAGEEKLEYHEDGQPCKYFTAADMQKIVDRAMFYVSYNTTYCNAVNMWIKSAEKASDLEQIQWGAEIPEEFQNEVLKDYMKILASGGIS